MVRRNFDQKKAMKGAQVLLRHCVIVSFYLYCIVRICIVCLSLLFYCYCVVLHCFAFLYCFVQIVTVLSMSRLRMWRMPRRRPWSARPRRGWARTRLFLVSSRRWSRHTSGATSTGRGNPDTSTGHYDYTIDTND